MGSPQTFIESSLLSCTSAVGNEEKAAKQYLECQKLTQLCDRTHKGKYIYCNSVLN